MLSSTGVDASTYCESNPNRTRYAELYALAAGGKPLCFFGFTARSHDAVCGPSDVDKDCTNFQKTGLPAAVVFYAHFCNTKLMSSPSSSRNATALVFKSLLIKAYTYIYIYIFFLTCRLTVRQVADKSDRSVQCPELRPGLELLHSAGVPRGDGGDSAVHVRGRLRGYGDQQRGGHRHHLHAHERLVDLHLCFARSCIRVVDHARGEIH